MPQFLLELFSEEIPARMQKRAAEDLKKLLMDALTKAGFLPSGIETFSAARRLVAVVEGLPERTPDVREERKGPKVGSPEQALAGFLRGAGLSDISQARVVSDEKKGDFYVADIVKVGQATPDAIAAIVPDIITNFPWPKSMRWGEGTLRWVRPLHAIVAVFDGEIVPFEVGGITSGNVTQGHRFHGKGKFTVRDFDDYEAKLTAAHVVLDREERKARIMADARTLCEARNLELVDDIGLLEEVCGLVDEPHIIMGDMDPAFLDLPPEVIRLTLRVNQKYFVVRDPATGALAPHFIVVSNVAAVDDGVMIAQGNARVLAARLNDAKYFWDLDNKVPLMNNTPNEDDEANEDDEPNEYDENGKEKWRVKMHPIRYGKLQNLVFHDRLGFMTDKISRIEVMLHVIGEALGELGKDFVDLEQQHESFWAIKADLTTEMVAEFPELQGVMGRYYALEQGLPVSTADAIRDHYKPIGPSDSVPTAPISIVLALADKIDTLVGFFAIGEKPTGSGDPYALRRAALGVLRIIIENRLKSFDLDLVLDRLWHSHGNYGTKSFYIRHIQMSAAELATFKSEFEDFDGNPWRLDSAFDDSTDLTNVELEKLRRQYGALSNYECETAIKTGRRIAVIPHHLCLPDLKQFFRDRLEIELRRYGYSADHIKIFNGGSWRGGQLGYAQEMLDSFTEVLTPNAQQALTAVARRTWNILAKSRSLAVVEEFQIWLKDQKGITLTAKDNEAFVSKILPMTSQIKQSSSDELAAIAREFQTLHDEMQASRFVDGDEQDFTNLLAQCPWRSSTTAEAAFEAVYVDLHHKISDALGAENYGAALKALIQFEQPLARYFEDVFVEEAGKRMDRLVHLAKAYKLISMVGDFR